MTVPMIIGKLMIVPVAVGKFYEHRRVIIKA
jgi:hypothetical protein